MLNDCISIARDATRAITINTSENVGIGTTNPTRKLHVLGTGNSNPSAAEGIFLQTFSGGGLDIYATSTAANPVFNFRTFANEEISFSPNSTEVMRLKGSKVGIGNTNPDGKLTIGSGLSTDNSTMFNVNGQYNDVGFNGGTSGLLTQGVWSFINSATWDQTRFYVQDQNNVDSRLTFDFKGNAGNTNILAGTSTGKVGIGTTGPGEKLEVNGSVKATASTDAYKGYIKQTIAAIANEKTDSDLYLLIPYNTINTVNSDQYYNRMVAAYDGRIKKVYIRNTGGTPTADTVNFKKQINNTTAATVYSATVANAGSAGMSAVYNFADNDFTFNEGDTFGILYQTVNSVGSARSMAGVAINIIVEYNIT